jgi:hypothetical protein
MRAAAAPGADNFIKRLNVAGFEAVVATTASVDPIMAGKYFNLLAERLERNKNLPDYSLSRAHFDAVWDLKTKESYGAKALIYSLLGNGALRVYPLPRNPATRDQKWDSEIPARLVSLPVRAPLSAPTEAGRLSVHSTPFGYYWEYCLETYGQRFADIKERIPERGARNHRIAFAGRCGRNA